MGPRTWLGWWRDSTVRDVFIALVMALVTLAGAYGEAHPTNPADIPSGHHIPHTPDAALLLVVVAALVLAGRRRYPMSVLAISTAAVTAYGLLGYVNGAALLSPYLALYTVAVGVTARRAVVAAAVTLVVLMASTAAGNPFGPAGGGFLLIPALISAALFGGIAVSNRRAYVASIQARADDEARRQVGEERLRIARELHDVVAHTMSTINVQASAAAQVLTARPEAAAQALQAIRTASKDGLRELRAILNVLRQADEDDPTTPTPGLHQLDQLIGSTVAAGLPTALTVLGEPTTLTPAVDLTAYRIVQESLTNVIRHAGPATANVSLAYRDAELCIEVADTGRGGPAGTGHGSTGHGGTGHGLIGMRERAAAVGGTLTAGPSGKGGYLVTARLPLGNGDRPDRPSQQDAAEATPAEEGARP